MAKTAYCEHCESEVFVREEFEPDQIYGLCFTCRTCLYVTAPPRWVSIGGKAIDVSSADYAKVRERFLAKVDVRGIDVCWLWKGATNGQYGQIRLPKTRVLVRAHRLSYWFAYGELLDGSVVCHSCDTPLCVNPRHLFLSSSQYNTGDRDVKGRQNGPRKESRTDSR